MISAPRSAVETAGTGTHAPERQGFTRPVTDHEFALFQQLIRQKSGICLTEAKRPLLMNRLGKRLRTLGFSTYRDYFDYVTSPGNGRGELETLLDLVTTNKTEFFREPKHWLVLRDQLWPELFARKRTGGTLRLWSAACSSGEEAYSLLLSYLKYAPACPPWTVDLLASDISYRMLDQARTGAYEASRVASIPPQTLERCFVRRGDRYVVREALRAMIRFERINLAEPFSWLREPFDLVLCRNVIIYFDPPTQCDLLQRLHQAIAPKGYLLVGHAESLNGLHLPFRYIAPAVYQRQET